VYHFHINWINIIQTASAKQTRVLVVRGSLNHIQDIKVNTIAPIAKPNRRDGHKLPLKWSTMYLVVPMYNKERGTPNKAKTIGCSFIQGYLNCPCSCINVHSWASIPKVNPIIKFIC